MLHLYHFDTNDGDWVFFVLALFVSKTRTEREESQFWRRLCSFLLAFLHSSKQAKVLPHCSWGISNCQHSSASENFKMPLCAADSLFYQRLYYKLSGPILTLSHGNLLQESVVEELVCSEATECNQLNCMQQHQQRDDSEHLTKRLHAGQKEKGANQVSTENPVDLLCQPGQTLLLYHLGYNLCKMCRHSPSPFLVEVTDFPRCLLILAEQPAQSFLLMAIPKRLSPRLMHLNPQGKRAGPTAPASAGSGSQVAQQRWLKKKDSFSQL